MTGQHSGYEIDDSPERIDFSVVHSWLTNTYWSPGISLDLVERAARGSSLVIGAYLDGVQVGYARIVSDRATFAWVCDVFVEEAHRRRGLARAIVRFALAHPEHQGLRRWMLATSTARGVYEPLGFQIVPNPEEWMIYRPARDVEELESMRAYDTAKAANEQAIPFDVAIRQIEQNI